MKQQLSKIEITITIGFLYWLSEHKDLRGLRGDILNYPDKLKHLLKEYNSKYPDGLTGWINH